MCRCLILNVNIFEVIRKNVIPKKCQYDASIGVYTVRVPKVTPGEEFKSRRIKTDLLTKLITFYPDQLPFDSLFLFLGIY